MSLLRTLRQGWNQWRSKGWQQDVPLKLIFGLLGFALISVVALLNLPTSGVSTPWLVSTLEILSVCCVTCFFYQSISDALQLTQRNEAIYREASTHKDNPVDTLNDIENINGHFGIAVPVGRILQTANVVNIGLSSTSTVLRTISSMEAANSKASSSQEDNAELNKWSNNVALAAGILNGLVIVSSFGFSTIAGNRAQRMQTQLSKESDASAAAQQSLSSS